MELSSSPRTFRKIALAAAIAAAGSLGLTRGVQGAVFTYTPTNSTSDLWSAGTDWSATPISDPTTTLTFVGTNGTVLANGLTNVNTDDIAGGDGNFQLNILNLQGTGPSSGAGTITIARTSPSTGLEFITNGTTTPVVNLNAMAGTAGLTYNVTAPITLTNNVTFQGNGTANFNFTGGVSGGANTITKDDSSTLTFSGNVATTGAITVNQGTLGETAASGGTFTLGTGNVVLRDTLSLTGLAGQTVNFTSASASASTFTFGNVLTTDSSNLGGNDTLSLNVNGGTLLTYTIGTSGSSLVRSSTSTLTIRPSALSNLGSTEKLFVSGLAATGTIYGPYVVVQDVSSNNAADFVTYTGSTNGFEAASLVSGVEVKQSSGTHLSTENSTAVVFNVDQTGAALTTGNATVYSLRTGYSISIGTGDTLFISNATATAPAGLLLNGNGIVIGTATANQGTVSFGSAGTGEGVVYTAQAATINSAVTAKGTLTLFGPGTLTINGNVTLGGSAKSFVYNSQGNTIINGSLSGLATFQYMGTGNLTLNADNSGFSGTVTIGLNQKTYTGPNPGTLTIGHDYALGTGTVDLYNTASSNSAFATLATSQDVTIGNNVNFGVNTGQEVSNIAVIAGTGSLIITGNVTGQQSSTTTLQNNIASGKTLTFAGSTFTLNIQSSLILNGTGDWVISAQIVNGTDIPTLTYSGTGTLDITGTTNSYTKSTTITSGTVKIASITTVGGGNSSLGDPATSGQGTISIGSGANAATLVYAGTGDTTDRIIDLAGAAGGATLDQSGTGLLKFTSAFTASGAGNKTLILQGSTAGTGEIDGAIINHSATQKTSVAKTGTGTWTLSGTNTYTGGTTITQGTLVAASTSALGAGGTITISGGQLLLSGSNANTDRLNDSSTMNLNGGTFNLNGLSEVTVSGSGVGALSVSANSHIDFGSGSTNSVVQFAGVGTHTPGAGTLTIDDWNGTAGVANTGGDQLLFAGTDTAFTSVFNQSDVYFTGFGSGYQAIQDTGYYEIVAVSSAVPEPASLALLGLGAAALFTRRRRGV